MEYIEKGDLQGYLTQPLPENEVKQIIFQLLEGLVFMHGNGFAHRDLKPAVRNTHSVISGLLIGLWIEYSGF